MDFKLLHSLLNSNRWYGLNEDIEILKGKYHKCDNPKEMVENAIREYKINKNK